MSARIRFQMGADALDAAVASALVLVPSDAPGEFRAYYVASPDELSHMLAALIAACMREADGPRIVAHGVFLSRQMRAQDSGPFGG